MGQTGAVQGHRRFFSAWLITGGKTERFPSASQAIRWRMRLSRIAFGGATITTRSMSRLPCSAESSHLLRCSSELDARA